MSRPKVRLVFDRKHVSSKTKKGLVQIEILYEGRRKWITTGIKLYKDQWHERRGVINSLDAIRYNDELHKQVSSLEEWIFEKFVQGRETFDWGKLDGKLNATKVNDNFIDFVAHRVEHRKDIRESTRRTQRKIVKSLNDFGKIKYFSDLNKANIIAYDSWLHENYDNQSTIGSYIKFLKTYVNDALKMELIHVNPFLGLKFKKGTPRYDKFLTEEEVEAIKEAQMPTLTPCFLVELAYYGTHASEVHVFGGIAHGFANWYKSQRVGYRHFFHDRKSSYCVFFVVSTWNIHFLSLIL